MRLSLFRSKSSNSSPSPSPSSSKKTSRFGQMLSPTRSRPDDQALQTPSLSSSAGHSPIADVPVNPPSFFEGTTAGAGQKDSSASDLPTIPSDGGGSAIDSSFAQDPLSNADGEQSVIDERAMTRKLMDVESSFLPDPAPAPDASTAPSERQPSALTTSREPFDSSLRQHSSVRTASETTQVPENKSSQPAASTSDRFQASSSRAARPFARPSAPFPDEDQVSYGDSSFSQSSHRYRSALSSPAAAAAERTKLRAASNYLDTPSRAAGARSASRSPLPEEAGATEDQSTPTQLPTDRRQTSITSSFPTSNSQGFPHTRTNLYDSSNRYQSTYSRRPEHLRQRQSSQRASKDSFMSQRSVTTVGPNYDGQSGDATPGTNARGSRELSRLPSLGSVASSVSGGTELAGSRSRRAHASSSSVPRRNEALDSLDDDGDRPDAQAQLETPRASAKSVAAPSNTVLAQHVRDVEVPDTAAREYIASHVPGPAESQSTNSTPFYGRGKSNLTLKEQNSKLDKLSKENFDLKLKIHYLHQALQDRSDEGVSDIISQNAQLQADLVRAKKENQALRKNVRNLEGKQRGWENASASLQPSAEGSEDDSSRANVLAQLEDEVVYLREQAQSLEEDNARLLEGGQPEWDTLDRETSRRKQAEREIRELRQQLEQVNGNTSRLPHLRIQGSHANLAQSEAGLASEDREVGSLSGNTLVEQLKYENATLRRDLGAQTDMLSSRNRERERLQQEIEDLKLVQRRGDQASSATEDSILDRSVSRAQYRSTSRASESTRDSDQDRDRLESVHANLRDDNAALKMRNQDLQRELNSLGEGAEHIRTLQAERDDATQALREADGDIDYLYDQMNQLEELVLQKEQDIATLEIELREREEESKAFRVELKSFNESFNALADDSEANQATIQSLRQDIANANGELEAMETNLRDVASAKERLEVQQESAEGEIAFLREEQEADKLKIGDLQSALSSAKASLQSEEETLRQFEELESHASKARDEARQLRKKLTASEGEHKTVRVSFDELQGAFDEAMKDFERTKASLHDEMEKLRGEAEERLQQLDQNGLELDEKDRVLQDREGLLESSGNENRRLADLLDKERQGRKHDRNEYDRALRSTRGSPEIRILELETANYKAKERAANLEQSHRVQIKSRDTLFLSLWNRLSSLCTNERLMEPEQEPQTVQSIAGDLEAFDQHISTVMEAIETHVGGFRHQLLTTEKAIWEGFKTLELTLSEREARVEELEQGMQRVIQGQSERKEYDATVEYVTRLKQENKLLKRELRYLKQGSFALPGLHSPLGEADQGGFPTPRDFDLADTMSMSSMGSVDQLTVQKAKHRHSAAHGGSMLLRAHSAGESDRTAQGSGDLEQQSVDRQPPKRSASTLATVQDIEATTSAVSIPKSYPQQQRATAEANAAANPSPADQRWILKFEALKRSLKAEKEGRLLDRDGARKRLEEGKRQADALKQELRRERVKREAAAAAAVASEDNAVD